MTGGLADSNPSKRPIGVRKPLIAILGCPACNGRGDGCEECAEQGWIVTEPTEPPIVYMTRARYDELAADHG
jgi:hypothetical protein